MSAREWRQALPNGEVHRPNRACTDDLCARVAVIPFEDRERVERLAEMYEHSPSVTPADQMQAALREFANPTPPKPDEPLGLGAVVEDADGVRWYLLAPHIVNRRWACWDAKYEDCDYDEIAAVRILSAGVKP